MYNSILNKKYVPFLKEYQPKEDEVFKILEEDGANLRYLISNYGYLVSFCFNKWRLIKLRPYNGYLCFRSRTINNNVPLSVHRLVAKYFVPNDDPANKTFVHHKDGNKQNNVWTNLEWVSPEQHNIIHKKKDYKMNEEI